MLHHVATTLRRQVPVAVTAAVVCSLFAGGPVVARAAFDAHNADKVDGKHAVGASTSVAKRKGKLVATSPRTGRLPSNIIATAPNAKRLDGLAGSAYRVPGKGLRGATTNITSCGAGVVVSYALPLSRPARIFAAADSTYGRSNPGPERPTIRIQLLDSSSTVVAQTGRVAADGSTGNPTLSIAGVLLTPDGTGPYTATPGSYTLRVWGDNFGSCTGFGQYQDPSLTHLELAG